MMSKNNHCLEGNKEIFTKSLFSQLSDNIRENMFASNILKILISH